MRKNYFLTLLFTLCLTAISFGQVIITELADPNGELTGRYVEIYNVSSSPVDLTGWALQRWTNDNTDPTTSANVDLSSIGTLASGSFAIIARDESAFQTIYGISADIDAGDGGPADSNGDDQIAIIDASDNIIDIFGVPEEDGTGTCHEFEDGRAERIGSVAASAAVWDESEWNVWADSTVSGCTSHTNSPRTAPGDYDPGVWIGTSSDPELSISSPSDNVVFSPETTNISIVFSVQNFTLSGDNGSGMSDGSGDGYIVGTAVENGAAPESVNIFDTTQAYESLVPGDEATLTVELVDNAGNSLSPAVTASVSFSVAEYTQAANIIALRAGSSGDYFELTGEAILTFIGTSRNQKYIEDASAAILIDDDSGTITTSYNVGDGITGIRGQISSFGDVTQFVPQADPGAVTSTGNTITAQVVTIGDLLTNLDNYESEWITINDVRFTDADGTATFATGSNYDITDGTDTIAFRVHFTGTDIDGTVIPSSSVNITGLAAEFNGTVQIMGTNLVNIVLGVERNGIEGYAAYPNPVTGNSLTIISNSIENKRVDIFNVLGKKVFSQTFSGTQKKLEISNVSSGIYILKVTEGTKISTQKLIIE